MARNPVFFSPHDLKQKKKKAIAVEFASLIVAVLKRISVEYT